MDSKSSSEYLATLNAAKELVVEQLGIADVALILGSGLGEFVNELTDAKSLSYADIPGMPQPTVQGHSGKLVFGTLDGTKVICLAGRSHAYEGQHMYQLCFSARLLATLGCKVLIATNAAGGSGDGMTPGSIMLITDHINGVNRSPLGDTFEHGEGLGVAYSDFAGLYSERLADVARTVAKSQEIDLYEGVYHVASGPSYETPTEVHCGTRLGAHAFGMSTFTETLAAGALGVEIQAFSLCTNLAAGLSADELTHEEVAEVASAAAPKFMRFMRQYLIDVTAKVTAADAAAPPKPIVAGHVAHPRVVELPTPSFAPRTSEQLDEAVAHVRKALGSSAEGGGALCDVALSLAHGHDATLESTNSNSCALANIPNVPLRSPSVRHGELRLVDGRLYLCGADPEGYAAEEATFLASILHALGVRRVGVSFNGGALDESLDIGAVVRLADVGDVSTVRPVVATRLGDGRSTGVAPLVIDESATATYMRSIGPSYATPAEAERVKRMGASLCGVGTPALVYASASLGLSVAAACVVTHALSKRGSIADAWKHANDASSKIVETLVQATSSLSDAANIDPDDLGPAKVAVSRQFVYDLNRPVALDDDLVRVRSVADRVRAQIGNVDVSVAIVVDRSVAFAVQTPNDGTAKVVPLDGELDDAESKLCARTLRTGKIGESQVFVVDGMARVSQGHVLRDTTLPIRVLRELGVKSVLVVTSGAATSKIDSETKIIVARDHCNWTGRNPLIGANEPTWGTRFPDMSEPYDAAVRDALLSAHAPAVAQGVVGYSAGALFASPLDDRMFTAFESDLVLTDSVPDIVVARHMRLKTTLVAAVNGSVSRGTATGSLANSLGDSLAAVVATAVTELAK